MSTNILHVESNEQFSFKAKTGPYQTWVDNSLPKILKLDLLDLTIDHFNGHSRNNSKYNLRGTVVPLIESVTTCKGLPFLFPIFHISFLKKQ